MKTLDLNQMEVLNGGSCLDSVVAGGITGAVGAGVFSGATAAPLGFFVGFVATWVSCEFIEPSLSNLQNNRVTAK